MEKHQGCAFSLPVEDIIGQVDRVDTAGRNRGVIKLHDMIIAC